MNKEYLSAIGITLTFIAYFPYLRAILLDKIKPHVFSWVIWGATTFIVFLAQLSAGGGIGAWVIGISGIMVSVIAIFAYLKKSDTSVTKLDWLFMLIAIVALCSWYFSDNALSAVVILTVMNVVGFGPTIRKSYSQPFEEKLSFFAILVPRNLISIMALEHYSLTTVFFPAVTALACLTLIALVLYRRRVISTLAT